MRTKHFIYLVIFFFISFFAFKIIINEKRIISNQIIKDKIPEFIPADDWFEMQRKFPFTEIPNDERLKAIDYVENILKPNSSGKYSNLNWQFAGPTNIEGRITDIAIDPSNPQTAYIATANGGLWKSTNFCQSYQPIFDNQNTSSIGCVAIDPNNSNIIYCGTGETNSLRSYYPGTGLYKSTNKGISWNLIGLENSFCIGRIQINPYNSNEIYVAALGALRKTNIERGIYKSTNGGQSWQNILFVADSVGAIDVLIVPNNPTKIFAAMWERTRREDYNKYGGPKSALYVSTNSGANWNVVGGGFPSNTASLGRISMDICKADPNILYALIGLTSGYSGGLYKSTNGGNNWTLINSSVAASSLYSWFNRICRVNPGNSNNVYCGGLDMEASTDGGTSFLLSMGYHVDHHAVAFASSNTNFVLIGNDGGVESSTNGGSSWIDSENLPVTQFYAGEINPHNSNMILGGTQDNGTIKTTTGNINDWSEFYGGDGFYCRIDPANQLNWYASSQYGGIGRSTNSGSTFLSGTSGLDLTYTNWMTPYVLDKINPSTIYCGTYKIYKSTNRMANWTAISPDLANGHSVYLGTVSTIDVSKSNPNIIYAGTDDANVWVTTNGGSNWTKIISGLPNRWITRVVVHPDSANVCYVTLSGYKVDLRGAHIFRTTNFGSSWNAINGNLPDAPINDVVIDPLDFKTLIIATDNGVMYTTNLGTTWNVLGNGIPSIVPCHDLVFNEANRQLVVFTHGRSAYKIFLSHPIPVELAAFSYYLENNSVHLKWKTESEKNNRGFEIQKTNLNLDEWKTIGFVKGKGTISEQQNYFFVDKNVSTGNFLFRLKQIDYDGSFTYSKILEIKVDISPTKFLLEQNYPNPFSANVKNSLSQNLTTKINYSIPVKSFVTLKVFDILGREAATLVNEEKQQGKYSIEFNGSKLLSGMQYASGVYFYQLKAGMFIDTKKMILLH